MVGVTPGACQIAGPGDTASPLPWDGDRRGDAKTNLFRFVAGTPEGANLPYIVRTVFGRDTDLAGADAQLARRFFADHPELFETARRDGFLWVNPTPAARRSGNPIDAPADLWKIALYWATGKRFFDGTGELTDDDMVDDENGRSLPHVRRYRFVGACRYDDLPGYVRDRAAFLSARDARGRPPPP